MYHNYTDTDFEQLFGLVTDATKQLLVFDTDLFSMLNQATQDLQERKLHEVCINHRLAVYLERSAPKFGLLDYFVDIEYNRNMENPKEARRNANEAPRIVRPDILIHRRTNLQTEIPHYLVIEAKKGNTSDADIDKIGRLLQDDRFRYKFGLTISYLSNLDFIIGKVYYYEQGQEKTKEFKAAKH